MKLFAKEMKVETGTEACATLVLEGVPLVMRSIRAEVMRVHPLELSLPQFRTMAYLLHHEGASLTDLADYLGLCPSTASKTVEMLVQRQSISRVMDAQDRRRMILSLTESGQAELDAVLCTVHASLVVRLNKLSKEEQSVITEAMQVLLRLFMSQPPAA